MYYILHIVGFRYGHFELLLSNLQSAIKFLINISDIHLKKKEFCWWKILFTHM